VCSFFVCSSRTYIGVIFARHINHHLVHTVPIATAASKGMIITVFGWEHVRLFLFPLPLLFSRETLRLLSHTRHAFCFSIDPSGIGKKNLIYHG
jgi:hypothetical protein